MGCGGCGLNSSPDAPHPMPYEDSKLMVSLKLNMASDWWFVRGKYRYGFNSLDQFRAWFYDDKDLIFLHERGFHLSIYDVPQVYEGNSQSLIPEKFHDAGFIEETKALNTI